MRLGKWAVKAALVAAIGLSLGYWVRGLLLRGHSRTPSDFEKPSPQVRVQSILAEPFRGPSERHCMVFLENHEEVVREVGKEGVPFLMSALEDDNADVRLKATLCLSALGRDAAPAVNALRPLLKSRKDRQAYWTIVCLGEIGRASKVAVPDFLSLLVHPRGCPFWQQVGEAVADIGTESGRVPEGLPEWLADSSPAARYTAIFALGECGALAEPLLPRIIASLRDPHLLVRIHAALSLGKIGRHPELALPALRKTLHDPKPSVRCAAATAIGDFGSDGAEAVPELIELLGFPISRVRADAATALGKIGPQARQAVPALTKLLEDEYLTVRRAAVEALRKLSPAASPEVPAPSNAPSEAGRNPCLAPTWAVGEVADVKGGVPAFTETLKDEGGCVRHAARRFLELMLS